VASAKERGGRGAPPPVKKKLVPVRITVATLLLAIPAATLLLDKPQVRIFRTTDNALSGVDSGPGVVIALDDAPGSKAGTAVWMDNVRNQGKVTFGGALVVVQPRRVTQPPPVATPAPSPATPGASAFVGMTFNQLFENDMVRVTRARMDVGAREGFHTHGADTIVVHLSGGEIEDTADSKTVVNRWKRGDVEFEARGSSHSARNIGQAVDVVLVSLKP
jgi:quercetin dioxygenase-like cupin family protein